MKKVLFIDNDKDFLDLVKTSFYGLPMRIDVVNKLSTAYEMISYKKYDFIFLDYHMGSCDADGFIPLIKSESKIYILTGYGEEFVKEKLAEYQDKISGHINKVNCFESVIKLVL